MNIEQLVYIVEVVKMKSLVETAKTLNVSQSALSRLLPVRGRIAHDAQFIQAVPLKLSNVSFRFGWVRLHDYKLSIEAQRF